MSESILLPSPHATALTHEQLPQGPMTNEERERYESQRQLLYQQADERDEEIAQQSRLTEQLRQQLVDQVCICKFKCLKGATLSRFQGRGDRAAKRRIRARARRAPASATRKQQSARRSRAAHGGA